MMKTKKIWLSAATAAAVFASAWLSATPGRAQTSELPPPAATAIPLDAPVDPGETAQRTGVSFAPEAVQVVTWRPINEYLRPDSGRNVTVTARSGLGLDFQFARFLTYDSFGDPVGVMSATVAATSTLNGIDVMTLTMQLPLASAFSSFSFAVKEDGITAESRRYKAGFPTYVTASMSDFAWPPTNLDGVEPGNDNQCTIGAGLVLEKVYNGTFKSGTDADWQYIEVGSLTTMLITATNVPVPSQLQVFVVPDGKCTSISGSPTVVVADKSDPSVTLANLNGGRVYVRLVPVMVSASPQRYSLRVTPNPAPPTSGLLEDNDNPCQATPTMSDTTYTSFGDDNYDFFELNVPTTGTLSMTLGADVITQLDLRSPVTDSGCSATTSTRALKQVFIVNNTANIQYFLTPGRYYARVFVATANIPNPARSYNFRWTLAAGSKPAKVCIGQDDSIADCAGDVPLPGWIKLKWEGLNGNARIKMNFTGNGGGGTGTCRAGPAKYIELTVSDINGVRLLNQQPEWQMAQGGYAVSIVVEDAANPANRLYSNEQSIKVGCQFRPAGVLEDLALPELMP
jgi:hypothetical protein